MPLLDPWFFIILSSNFSIIFAGLDTHIGLMRHLNFIHGSHVFLYLISAVQPDLRLQV